MSKTRTIASPSVRRALTALAALGGLAVGGAVAAPGSYASRGPGDAVQGSINRLVSVD